MPAPTPARADLIVSLRQAGPGAAVDASDAADETARLIRQQFRAFTEAEVVGNAPVWHGADQLIPLELIAQLAELGVFGLTTPAEFGGSEMGAEAMCVVTEELSRGYIGVGSLGTRNEIACELIRTTARRSRSSAGCRARHRRGAADRRVHRAEQRLRPRQPHDAGGARRRRLSIHGNKTWITHAARADLMVLLARTDPADQAIAGSRCSSPRSRAAPTTTRSRRRA